MANQNSDIKIIDREDKVNMIIKTDSR